MNSDGSVLNTILTRIRFYLDDPDVDAKYTDDFLLRHALMPSMVDVLSRLNQNAENRVVNRLAYTLSDDTLEYVLPPCMQTFLKMIVQDANGVAVCDMKPRGFDHIWGPGISFEGNILRLDPLRFIGGGPDDLTVYLWYVSNGDVFPHLSTAGGTLALNSDGRHTFTLGTAAKGQIDRRVNAYAGQTLRLLPASPAACEERVVESSDLVGSDWVLLLRNNFTETAVGAAIPYEVCPPSSQALMEATAILAAQKLGISRKISQPHQQALVLQYRSAMKTIGDNLAMMNERSLKTTTKATIDRGIGPLSE